MSFRHLIRTALGVFALILAAPTVASAAPLQWFVIPASQTASYVHNCSGSWTTLLPGPNCWTQSETLRLGGDGSNTWRTALKFDVSSFVPPPGGTVVLSFVRVTDEGTCTLACDGVGFEFEATPVVGNDWFSGGEPLAGLPTGTGTDNFEEYPWEAGVRVTPLVIGWLNGEPNSGVLLKLTDDTEFPDTPGAASLTNPYLEIGVRVP